MNKIDVMLDKAYFGCYTSYEIICLFRSLSSSKIFLNNFYSALDRAKVALESKTKNHYNLLRNI
jgi:hypothetical protein